MSQQNSGPSDLDSNDRAFIKISKEIILLRHDLEALEGIKLLAGNVSAFHQKSLNKIRFDQAHSEGNEGMSKFIKLVMSHDALLAETNKTDARLKKLEVLAEEYMRGGSIVQKRLEMT